MSDYTTKSKQILTVFLLLFTASQACAQSINDEFRDKLRKSLISPENPPIRQKQLDVGAIKINPIQNDEVLKVSPYTKLPTKGDKLLIAPMQEVKINLNLNSSTPVNMTPRGSVKYVQNGRGISMESNAGVLIKPSGISFSPPRGRSEKRARTVRRIVENW